MPRSACHIFLGAHLRWVQSGATSYFPFPLHYHSLSIINLIQRRKVIISGAHPVGEDLVALDQYKPNRATISTLTFHRQHRGEGAFLIPRYPIIISGLQYSIE